LTAVNASSPTSARSSLTLAASRESRDTLLDALPFPLLVLPEREARRAA
jgi:hypothetical protein